jgi:hypothetical protein
MCASLEAHTQVQIMANPEHLEKLKEGVEAWNTWRRANAGIMPELRGANLSGAVLSEANLSGANLNSAKLVETNLNWAGQILLVRILPGQV